MGMLDDKVCIVTGAGHGIGRAHAMELAKHGARVVVNDIGGSVHGEGTGKDADLTVDIITERGGQAVANYGDVADHDAAGEMVAQAVDTWGRLDVLVNNAGIVRDTAIWNMGEQDFDSVIRVHLKGSWAPSKHAAIHWRGRAKAGESFTGRVINTTSGAGLVGNFGQTNYATAKAGIAGFTQTLSASSSTSSASPSTASVRPPRPASPAPCPAHPRSSRPTTSPTTSGTAWTPRCRRRWWPGWRPTSRRW